MANKKLVPPEFYQFLTVVAAGASGKKVADVEVNWPSVIRYAQEQAVFPLLGSALLVDPNMDCSGQLRAQLLNVIRDHSGANLVRKQRIFNLIRELEGLGVEVMLIKGYVVGDCYAYSECRGSADTDLLIPMEQEALVCDFLRKKGFRVEPRTDVSHHVVCQHPKLGMVEVHVRLYDEMVQDMWFQNHNMDNLLLEAPVRIADEMSMYTTLGYTDQLIFLTLHAVKHFIYGGFGVRMLLDIALFFKTHRKEINAERYWMLLEELRYSKVVRAMLWAMIDTGCFLWEDFPGLQTVETDAIELLLYDLEAGGHMGVKHSKEDLVHSASEYSRQVILRKKSPMQYYLYMLVYKIRNAKKQMFPEKEQLLRLYPFLKKQKWMTPFVRIYSMFAYPIRKLQAGVLKAQIRTDSTEMPDEAKRRVEMFRALGMI